MKAINYILGIVAVATTLTACHTYGEPENKSYVIEGSQEDWTVNPETKNMVKTIDAVLNDPTVFSDFGDVTKYPPRPRTYDKNQTNLGLFSVQDITKDIIIVGRIVSTDAPGNIYKSLYIQDDKNPDYGIKISVDMGSAGGVYQIGQKIAIKLKGLAIGKYARMPQIGLPYYNNGKDGMDNPGKVGWEIGRIPPAIFKNHVQLLGVPDKDKITVKTMTIQQIKATADNYKAIALLSSRLVKIDNVRFIPYTWSQQGALSQLSGTFNCATDETASVFAPTTMGIGYPQSRCFMLNATTDTLANTLAIGTSEYAKFACAPLPEDEYVGSVQGFVSYYYDNAGYSIVPNKVWTITINSLESLDLENASHDKWRADEVYYPAY